MEEFIKDIEQFFEENSFERNGNIWSRNGVAHTSGQVIVVNGVRQEIPGQPIQIEQLFEVIGECELMNEQDEVEAKYMHCTLDIKQDGESMGEICQLFSTPQECIDLVKQIFRM